MWLKILLVSVTIFFILILVVKRFIYFRPNYSFVSPRDTYTDIYEGNLHAWYKKGTGVKVILFCHGNAGNLSHRQDKLLELTKLGYSVLIFDYSGFGQSKGVPNEQLFYANASMFIDYLFRQGYTRNMIVPYGESMGAAVAAYVARKYNLSGLIIESGLPSVKTLLKSINRFLGLLGFIFSEFDTVSYLDGYQGKILILHCLNDEVVPFSSIGKMKEKATIMVEMQGTHNNPVIPWKQVGEFINSL